MGDRPELARLATDLLAAEPLETKKLSAANEERAIAAIEREIDRSRSRRRVRTGVLTGVLVVAAAAAAFVVLHKPASLPVAVASDDDDIVLTLGAERIGDRIVTHDGHATIAAKNGTRVAIDAHGDVNFERAPTSRKLDLHSGALEAHVAKLASGHRFVVTTADAEIEVRGTAFRVAVADEPTCGTHTSVSVSEGTVWVRFQGSESVVGAGSSWPKCEAALTPTPTPTPTSTSLPSTVSPPSTLPAATSLPTTSKVPAVETVSASVLAEQNRIFEEAIAAKRRGDVGAAVSGFERVTQGPLAESAAAERFRVLSGAKDSRAQAAARDYLAHYPNGFAQGEARAILQP